MQDFLQLVISGTASGAIYGLAAMGFTLLWQTSGTINFALGEFVMLPAFFILWAMHFLGLPLIPAFMLSLALSALVCGWGFKRGVVDPLFATTAKMGVLPLVVATLGLSMVLKNGIKALPPGGWGGAEAYPFPRAFPDDFLRLGGVTISTYDIGVLAFTALVVVGLNLFIQKTVTGRAMQASAQNPEGAAVIGIDVPRMILYTFVINALLAAVAALLVTPTYLAKFDMGDSIATKAFYASIIGGFNQTRGALLGGVIVGVCENLAAAYISPAYKDAVALVLFVIVILFKPEGLLGKSEGRRV